MAAISVQELDDSFGYSIGTNMELVKEIGDRTIASKTFHSGERAIRYHPIPSLPTPLNPSEHV